MRPPALARRSGRGPTMNRNDPCPCGSGKRYKHCHGAQVDDSAPQEATPPPAITARPGVVEPAPQVNGSIASLAAAADTAHRSGALREAERHYRAWLARETGNADAMHMLGVALFERMRYREALEWLVKAADRTQWGDEMVRHNLGLVLAKHLGPQADAEQGMLVADAMARETARSRMPVRHARVSVVIPVHNGAATIADALQSVLAQTEAAAEIVVVDAQSTDDTRAIVERTLVGHAIPRTLLVHDSASLATAANRGAAQATGDFVAFLGAADRYTPQRIALMLDALARQRPSWGFSRTARVVAAPTSEATDGKSLASRDSPHVDDGSFSLLKRDALGADDNLIVDREFFRRLGGFRDLPAHRGWDFATRAALDEEPVIVEAAAYVADARRQVAGDEAVIARALTTNALTTEAPVANVLAPQHPRNRTLVLRDALRAGQGEFLPVERLRRTAHDVLARREPDVAALTPRANATVPRTAIVVLGVYRSGTSAIARVLNLCGAALPARLMAPRLAVNPTGFWEAEAINDLDARFLYRLGADWNSLDVTLPDHGVLVDELLADIADLLPAEFGEAPTILLKDPRICVLAPLWDRALRASGYRPVYVVPVRNPLEVARSLDARGDMPVRQGLALWHAYSSRAEAFLAQTDAPRIHVRYADVLDDWRASVAAIDRVLALDLDTTSNAAEIDRFLAAGRRHHHADASELDVYLAGPQGDALRTLYARLQARSTADPLPR